METITFTATFHGNPKPDITWYHNNKIIHQHASMQMRVRNDKAMLTIVEASPEMKGEYTCRAVNNEGEVFTRAKLDVIELTYEQKLKVANERYAAVQIQQAAEHMKEKERERMLIKKKEHEDAMARLKEDKAERQMQLQREMEDAKKNVWKPRVEKKEKKEKKVEDKVYDTPADRRVSEVYSNWKAPVVLEKNYPKLEPNEFAPNQIPGVKCFVKVSETSVKGEEVVRDVAPQFFEDEQIIHELAKVHTMLKNNIKVSEIWAMFRAGEFQALQQPSIQTALVKVCEYIGHQRNVSIVLAQETQEQARKHPVGLKAFLRMITHAKNVKPDTLFKDVIPREMGKFSSTTQELTKVSQMMNQGIQTEEIIASCVAGNLPTLKKPETQQPLINIVEKHGHSVMVAQVLVEEAYRDAKDERVLYEQAWESVHEQVMETAQVAQVKTDLPLTLLKETPQQETIPEHMADMLSLAQPTPTRADQLEEQPTPTHTAHATQVHAEMCVPGFKALVRLATDNQIDLDTVELKPLEKATFQKDIAKLNLQLKRGVQVSELMTMMKEGEFGALKRTELQAKLLDVVDRLERATVTKVLVQETDERSDRNIGLKSVIRTLETGRETMEDLIMDVSKEFGPTSEPVKEMAAVGHLLQEGVKCNEVIVLVESGLLPNLQQPQAQVPLVSMVAEKGHVTTVCEVLVEESAAELTRPRTKLKAARMSEVKELLAKAKLESVDVKTFTHEMVPGVKAYVRMAQEENINIEEVVQKAALEPRLKEEVAKIGLMVKHGVMAQDVMTLMETGEFPQLMREEAQAQLLSVVEDFGFRAIVNQVMTEQVEQAVQKTDSSIGVKAFMRMMQKANVNVEEVLTEKLPKEMSSEMREPVAKEIAKVSVMLKEGIQAEEIMSMVETGQLPNLKRPEAQKPLIDMVEDQGHSALVCQVLIEESVKDIIQELPKVDVATVSSVEKLQSASSSEVVVKVTSGCLTEPT